jgi:hypothetical protein
MRPVDIEPAGHQDRGQSLLRLAAVLGFYLASMSLAALTWVLPDEVSRAACWLLGALAGTFGMYLLASALGLSLSHEEPPAITPGCPGCVGFSWTVDSSHAPWCVMWLNPADRPAKP